MAEFAYNNTKNTSISHIPFIFNYGFYSKAFFQEDIYSRSRSCFTNKLTEKLKKLIEVCY